MKKKRYKKIVKKLNKLIKVTEANTPQPSVLSVWPQIWQPLPHPNHFEVFFNQTDPTQVEFVTTSN